MKTGARCPAQHRHCWAIGNRSAVFLWCYECGAIRQDHPTRDKKWTYPTGIGGQNPAMKDYKETK